MQYISDLTRYKKLFVTGLYGTGKSTLAKRIMNTSKTHSWLSYDHIVGYGERGNRFDLLYQVLESSDSFVVDALPVGIHYEHWDRFKKYLEISKSKVIVTKCDFEVWCSERLKNKKSVSNDKSELKTHYDDFYESPNGLYSRCMEAFSSSSLILYDTTHPKGDVL
jgi:shikimate kinase